MTGPAFITAARCDRETLVVSLAFEPLASSDYLTEAVLAILRLLGTVQDLGDAGDDVHVLVHSTVVALAELVRRCQEHGIEVRDVTPSGSFTAADVLSAARDRGVPAFTPTPVTHPKILLASLGLDLRSASVRERLIDLNRRHEIELVRVEMPDTCRISLIGRGVPSSMLHESEIRDSVSVWHAVQLPIGAWPGGAS